VDIRTFLWGGKACQKILSLISDPLSSRSIHFDFSVIIPAYNEEDYLRSTLDALRQACKAVSPLSGEIIVVDNQSTDQTSRIALDFGCKVVTEEIHQIAKVRNTGAKVAGGRYLIFVDADTLVPVATFSSAIHAMKSGEVGCGGACLTFDHDYSRWFSGKFLPMTWNLISVKLKLFAGSFIFCQSDLFFSCGGFPETHFAGEEIVLSRKLKKESRKRNKKVLILKEFPVVSSARKLEWYSDWSILKMMLPLFVFPLLLKSQSFCRFWYQRPTKN
jgi:glycosyltransferase involved in cell wall biosynthesis